MKFSASPSRIMRFAVNRPVLNMMTLGAVATGSMNAQLALMAAGIIKSRGSMAAPTAAAARIGMSSEVVAVLLVASVRKVTARQTARMMANTGQAEIMDTALPIDSESPDDLNAAAMASPAPNSISMPQGIFAAVSQSSRRPPLPSGTMNIKTTARNATMASFV